MRFRLSQIRSWLRQGIPAFALYALVLQAFLTGAAPATAFQLENAPLCADLSAGTHVPEQKQSHPDCLCLAQCLQAYAPAALVPASATAFAPRASHHLSHRIGTHAVLTTHPLERSPGARAPPAA